MFTWIPLYQEIARKVLEFENNQGELVALLRDLADRGLPIGAREDEDAAGNRGPLWEIDPFSFFATCYWQAHPQQVSDMANFGPRLAASSSIRSSPNIFARLPRLISSMMKKYGRPSCRARRANSWKTPLRSLAQHRA